jgi:nicotinamidase-related amidase
VEWLRRDGCTLVLVDLQERLLNAFADDTRGRVLRHATALIESAGLLGLPFLVTEQYPRGLGPTVSPIRDRMGNTAPIDKTVFSCARSPEFRAALDATGRRDVLMCGIETHVCVLQTAGDLIADGFRIHVAADATGSRRNLDWERGLAVMERAGAVVGTTEMFLFQLLERAGTDEFRAVSRLIK